MFSLRDPSAAAHDRTAEVKCRSFHLVHWRLERAGPWLGNFLLAVNPKPWSRASVLRSALLSRRPGREGSNMLKSQVLLRELPHGKDLAGFDLIFQIRGEQNQQVAPTIS